ncbi:MAG: M61 family peptidase, partial [Candidimonas sp.]
AWIPGSYLIRDFSRHIQTIRGSAESGDDITIAKIDDHSWRCAPCHGPLRVEYTVYAWDLSVRGAHFDASHAFFNGAAVFLGVDGGEHLPCLLELHPPHRARGWKVYTSLPEAQGREGAARRHGFGLYAAPDYDALIDHPVEMGTPQVVRFNAHGAQHEMVFTGTVTRLDLARIAADAQRICAAQIALFEPKTRRAPFLDSTDRYVFLATVTADGYGGLEHRASAALITARHGLPVRGRTEPPDGYTAFLGLLSHEYFHTWNVKRIKPAAFAPYDLSRPAHTRLLWVFEGFTSYYGDLMLKRSGVIDDAAYLRLLGKTISAVRRNSGRHKQTVAESSFDAWTRYYKQDGNSPNALVSYYTKGALIALGLDLIIRQATQGRRSLDDVMRLLWRRFGRRFFTGTRGGRGVPEGAMPEIIQAATGVDVRDFLDHHVDGCNDLPLDTLLASQGFRLVGKPNGVRPSLGIRTRGISNEIHIVTVDDNGAGHTAGLAAGDVLLAIDGLRVTGQPGLERLLDRHLAGDRVTLHVFRGDALLALELTLAAPEPIEYTLTASPGRN